MQPYHSISRAVFLAISPRVLRAGCDDDDEELTLGAAPCIGGWPLARSALALPSSSSRHEIHRSNRLPSVCPCCCWINSIDLAHRDLGRELRAPRRGCHGGIQTSYVIERLKLHEVHRSIHAKDMPVDMEKQEIENGVDAPAPVLAIAWGGEQEPLIPTEQGAVAAAKVVNTELMKWLPYWLLVCAVSFMVLPDGRDDHAAPEDVHVKNGELGMFVVFLCAICLMIQSLKKMG